MLGDPVNFVDPDGRIAALAIPLVKGVLLSGGAAGSAYLWNENVYKPNSCSFTFNVFSSNSNNVYYAKKSKSSNKERATDIPSWAKGTKPNPNQSPNDYANEQMNNQYGENNWQRKGQQGREYSQLKKWGQRNAK